MRENFRCLFENWGAEAVRRDEKEHGKPLVVFSALSQKEGRTCGPCSLLGVRPDLLSVFFLLRRESLRSSSLVMQRSWKDPVFLGGLMSAKVPAVFSPDAK